MTFRRKQQSNKLSTLYLETGLPITCKIRKTTPLAHPYVSNTPKNKNNEQLCPRLHNRYTEVAFPSYVQRF